MPRAARICCLDLDTFFVSVERVLDPGLEGRPVIVGGQPGSRGVVSACSYEVRELGVRSGMSLRDAGKLAPDAIYLPVRGGTYGEFSQKVRDIAADFTPVHQVASIDEMFLDFSGCERMYRKRSDRCDDDTIRRVVQEITGKIRGELGLPSSAGIAASRSMAKIASGLAKPAGVLLVPTGTERGILDPLPVRKLPGIGPVAEKKLHEQGIHTLGELAREKSERLRGIFGAWTDQVCDSARGLGSDDLGRDRPSFREHDDPGDAIGSLSNERTFREDVSDPRTIEAQLCSLAERVCWRARKRGIKARTISLKMRYSNFETLTRAKTVAPTCSEIEVYPIVRDLYLKIRDGRRKIRLLGIQLSNLGLFDDQMDLFDSNEGRDRAVDNIRRRFGYEAVGLLGSRRERKPTVTERPQGGGTQHGRPVS